MPFLELLQGLFGHICEFGAGSSRLLRTKQLEPQKESR